MRQYLARPSVASRIFENPVSEHLGLVVVIPAYDEPDLPRTMENLFACENPGRDVEVIVVLNAPLDLPPDIYLRLAQQRASLRDALWASPCWMKCLVMEHWFETSRKAGVGRARKAGMDEAAWRCTDLVNGASIPIAALDADCRVSANYLSCLVEEFAKPNAPEGASIYFEHDLNKAETSEAITAYELHLRTFVQGQRWAGFPFAFQTVGSSMVCTARAYCLVGGMNTRQAGEDFYFLQKIIERGKFVDITATTVRPSPRQSHRVPFGTGRATTSVLHGEVQLTYASIGYEAVHVFQDHMHRLYIEHFAEVAQVWPDVLVSFLQLSAFEQKLTEIRANTATEKTFIKRLQQWFNAFRLMKFMHFVRDNLAKNRPPLEVANWLLLERGEAPAQTERGALLALRAHDKLNGEPA